MCLKDGIRVIRLTLREKSTALNWHWYYFYIKLHRRYWQRSSIHIWLILIQVIHEKYEVRWKGFNFNHFFTSVMTSFSSDKVIIMFTFTFSPNRSFYNIFLKKFYRHLHQVIFLKFILPFLRKVAQNFFFITFYVRFTTFLF